MADPPSYPDSNSDIGDDTPMRADRESPPSTPRWVKVFVIIVIVVVLLVGIILSTGVGGPHGPGRHIPSGDAVETPSGDLGSYTPSIEHEIQQP
jgi:hypothetical protein